MIEEKLTFRGFRHRLWYAIPSWPGGIPKQVGTCSGGYMITHDEVPVKRPDSSMPLTAMYMCEYAVLLLLHAMHMA